MSEPTDHPATDRHASRFLDGLVATLLVAGYGAPLILGVGGSLSWAGRSPIGMLFGLAIWVGASIYAYRALRRRRPPFSLALEVLALAILPVWGLGFSHFMGQESCVTSDLGSASMRPFAEPEVLGLVALHVITALAFTVSKKRPEALPPKAEALLHAWLVVGALLQIVVGVHVVRWLPVGVLLAPMFLPCAGPWITLALYVGELRARLRRRGAEAVAPILSGAAPYREPSLQPTDPLEPAVHRPTLMRALALTPVLLGAHAVIHAVWLQRLDGAAAVFTRTCDYVLSTIPVKVVSDGHYLCTVAARGHRWLVKPERLGLRGGATIVVNRQLAVANAFEDLLHERWPRFGRLARAVYDRLGLPVSRWIRRAWLADLVYLAMKPAEWLFYAALLLLDRGAPEARIQRMYRG